jgi:PAS domain S-box-containing protein
VGVLSLLALVGYAYSAYQTYGLTYHRSMALHEAGALVIFSAAVLFARPQSGYVLTMTGQGHVGILVRRLLPWAVGVPFLLGWLRLEAERNGIQLTDIEFSLFVVSNMVIFSVLIWASARSLVATEQELVESEERYRSIFENSEDAILLTVPEGRILAANLAACRMFGRSEEEICQAGRRGLVDSSDPRLPLALEEGERTGRFKGELTFVRRNGERFPAEVTSTVFHDSQRNPHTSMIIRDITERKCAEEALRQSEERLRLITDNMLDMVSQLNMDGIHVYVSPAHKRALGYDPGEMLGKSIYEYLHPDDRERVTAAIQASLQSGSTGRAEFRYRHADGHYVWLETAGSLLFDDNGSSIGAILSGRDISERKLAELASKRAEEELKTAKSRLQRLSHRLLEVQENDRRAIARELHDEIGQILTAAKIDLQVVRRGNIPEDLAARLDENIASLDNCLSRVRNLSLDLRPSMLDDLGLVAALRWQLNRQAERAGFQVHLVAEDAPERLHPELETVCYRIVQEALTNIAKHAHAHNVWVELTSSDREVLLSVRDDGVGFHVESALADAAHGVSFGILGMQERASLLGGKLEIVSAREKGTTVTARFPLR